MPVESAGGLKSRAMAVRNDYLQYVLEQLSGLGRVTSRRMFGAAGLYCDGHFFGLISNDILYFKVDDSNRAAYEARGMDRFRPYPDKPYLSMTYYEVPADALEDGEELVTWARRSVAAAAAAASAKPRSRRPRKLAPRRGRKR
jgi:DNA transformation protein and related proteins